MEFNLLPLEYRPKKPKIYINILVGIYLMIFIIIAIYIKNVIDTKSIRDANIMKIKTDEQKTEDDRTRIFKLMQEDSAYNLFNTNKDKLKQIMSGLDFDYERFLIFLSDITPAEVSIEKIESKDNKVIIEGQTNSYEIFMNFYEKFKSANVFYEVNLTTFEIKLEEKVMVYKIECQTQNQNQTQNQAQGKK